jgi:nucleoside-diphosphate-sugar epimerase
MNKVLILGGTGFIGSRLGEHLSSRGWEVFRTSRDSRGTGVIHFNLKDAGSFSRILAEGNFSHIVSALGNTSARVSRGLDKNERRFLFEQFTNAHKELESGPTVLHLGSCAEYGSAARPFREGLQPLPVSVYGQGKLEESEFFLRLAGKNVNVVILRPSIVYDSGQTGDMLVPSILSSLVSGEPLTLREPASFRDFLYVDDLTEAIEVVLNSKSLPGTIYNVGSGLPVTVAEFARRLASELGIRNHLDVGDGIDEVVKLESSLEVDSSKIFRELGWKARFSFTDGISAMVKKI